MPKPVKIGFKMLSEIWFAKKSTNENKIVDTTAMSKIFAKLTGIQM
jgi:hypothetical protein